MKSFQSTVLKRNRVRKHMLLTKWAEKRGITVKKKFSKLQDYNKKHYKNKIKIKETNKKLLKTIESWLPGIIVDYRELQLITVSYY